MTIAWHLTQINSWPLNPQHGFLFAQTLVGQSQFLAVQEYVRLTQPWCDIDAASRSFILGQSYLHSKWVLLHYWSTECFQGIMLRTLSIRIFLRLWQASRTFHRRHYVLSLFARLLPDLWKRMNWFWCKLAQVIHEARAWNGRLRSRGQRSRSQKSILVRFPKNSPTNFNQTLQSHIIVNAHCVTMPQMQMVSVVRPKTDLEAWRRNLSWPLGSNSFSSYIIDCPVLYIVTELLVTRCKCLSCVLVSHTRRWAASWTRLVIF